MCISCPPRPPTTRQHRPGRRRIVLRQALGRGERRRRHPPDRWAEHRRHPAAERDRCQRPPHPHSRQEGGDGRRGADQRHHRRARHRSARPAPSCVSFSASSTADPASAAPPSMRCARAPDSTRSTAPDPRRAVGEIRPARHQQLGRRADAPALRQVARRPGGVRPVREGRGRGRRRRPRPRRPAARRPGGGAAQDHAQLPAGNDAVHGRRSVARQQAGAAVARRQGRGARPRAWRADPDIRRHVRGAEAHANGAPA